MARPSKSASAMNAHRAKSELDARKTAEKSLATGSAFNERPEVLKNPVAHAEFVRLDNLLSSIGKNDAIYETVINRYCTMLAECLDFEDKRDQVFSIAEKIEQQLTRMGSEISFEELRDVAKDVSRIYKTMVDIDKQIESKRKMLLSIEKENIMTVAAALRSVPKAPEKKENPLIKALNGDED